MLLRKPAQVTAKTLANWSSCGIKKLLIRSLQVTCTGNST